MIQPDGRLFDLGLWVLDLYAVEEIVGILITESRTSRKCRTPVLDGEHGSHFDASWDCLAH